MHSPWALAAAAAVAAALSLLGGGCHVAEGAPVLRALAMRASPPLLAAGLGCRGICVLPGGGGSGSSGGREEAGEMEGEGTPARRPLATTSSGGPPPEPDPASVLRREAEYEWPFEGPMPPWGGAGSSVPRPGRRTSMSSSSPWRWKATPTAPARRMTEREVEELWRIRDEVARQQELRRAWWEAATEAAESAAPAEEEEGTEAVLDSLPARTSRSARGAWPPAASTWMGYPWKSSTSS
jgi:hypothetical protein